MDLVFFKVQIIEVVYLLIENKIREKKRNEIVKIYYNYD